VFGLLPVLSFSQVEWHGYVPLRTYHFDREPFFPYHSTEGGNIGLVVTRRKLMKNNLFHDTNAGLVRNSYNKLSFILQKGFGIRTKVVDISANVGVATGYDILFTDKITIIEQYWLLEGGLVEKEEYEKRERLALVKSTPYFMREWGMIPMINLSFRFNTGRLAPLINVSPDFINGGITYKF